MLSLTSRRSRPLLVAALSAAVLAVGCGGDSDEDKAKDYREGLTDAHKEFTTELQTAGAVMRAAGQAKSPQQYGQGAEQLQSAVEKFKEELDALDPPDDAKDEEEDVNEAVDEFSSTVGRINAAVQSKDTEAIEAEQVRVRTEGQQVDKAIAELKEAVE